VSLHGRLRLIFALMIVLATSTTSTSPVFAEGRIGSSGSELVGGIAADLSRLWHWLVRATSVPVAQWTGNVSSIRSKAGVELDPNGVHVVGAASGTSNTGGSSFSFDSPWDGHR